MKTRFTNSFFLFISILFGLSLLPAKAETLRVGDRFAPTDLIGAPFSVWDKFSFSQVIYTKEELSAMKNKQITALDYYIYTVPNAANNTQFCEVYITYTDLDEFVTDPSITCTPLEGMTKVYSGTLTITQGGGAENPTSIVLATPFTYNGEKNLMITVSAPVKRLSTGIGSNKFYSSLSTGSKKQALTFADDNNGFEGVPLAPANTIKAESVRPNTTFVYGDKPTTPIVALSDTLLDFGFVQMDASYSKSVQIANTGVGTLSVSEVQGIANPFASDVSEISLTEGQSTNLTFTYTPTSAQETIQEVLLKTTGGDKKVILSGYAFSQEGLFENFEDQNLPKLWRTRSSGSGWTISTVSPYQGLRCIKVGSTQDTLISPKVNNGNLVFYLRDENLSAKEFQIIYSTDLKTWTILKNIGDLSLAPSTYVKQIIDLSLLPDNVFIGFVGKNMSIDNLLFSNVTRPQHDLYLSSFTSASSYNEETEAIFPVKIKNWGSVAENSFTLELRESITDVLLVDTVINDELASMEEKSYSIRWMPLPKISNFYAKVVLATDSDATNDCSPAKVVSIIPYIGVSKFASTSLNFDLLLADRPADTLTLSISNTGIAPLNITNVRCKAPFSISPSTSFTIESKSTQTVKIIFSQDNPRYYKDSLVFVHDGIGDSVLKVEGNIQRLGDLFESFEGTEFPPFMWRKTLDLPLTDNQWKGIGHQMYKGGRTAYQEHKTLYDTLITPKLHVQSGEKLSFYAKHWGNTKAVLNICFSTDLQTWTQLATYSAASGQQMLNSSYNAYTIDLPSGDYYIGFGAINEVCLDYIQAPQIIYPQKDLKFISSSIPKKGNVNNEMQISVTVQNIGNLAAENYTIFLMSEDQILAERKGETLAKLASKEMLISYTPTEAEILKKVYMKIVLEGDEDPSNNQGPPSDIVIYEEFFGEYLIGETNSTDNKYPFSTNYKFALEEMLYYPEELGFKAGSEIKGITYYSGSASKDLIFPIRMWIGETDLTSLKNAWIDVADLQAIILVDTVKLLQKNGSKFPVNLVFPESYTYKGGNLVILIEKVWSDVYLNVPMYNSNDLIHTERTRYYQTDASTSFNSAEPISFTPNGIVGDYPMTLFSVDRPTIKVSGSVKNDEGIFIDKAIVSLQSGAVFYTDTTNSEGFFEMTMSILSKEYTFNIISPDYVFTPRTFFIADTNVNLGNIIVSGNPFDYTVFVSSKNKQSLEGAIVELRSNVSVDYSTDTLHTVSDTATVIFKELSKGDYTLNIKHRDFVNYSNSSLQLTEAKTDSVVLQERVAIRVSGSVLSGQNNIFLPEATVTFSCGDIVYSNTTDALGQYSFSTNKMDRTYAVNIEHPIHKSFTTTFDFPITDKDTTLSPYTLQMINIILTLNVSTINGESLAGTPVILKNNASQTIESSNILADGRAIFDNLQVGIYTVEINKAGYKKYLNENLEIKGVLSQNIVLEKHTIIPDRASLTLNVSTSTAESLAGLPVYLENNFTGAVYDIELNARGQLVVDNLLKGSYTLEIFKEGFEKHIDTDLKIEDSLVLNIVLKENIINPYALDAKVLYNQKDASANVNFTWNEIGDYFMDSFEEYEDFTLKFDPWITIDRDGKGVVSLSQHTYPNMGVAQAATIFNPLAMTPIMENAFAFAYSGKKCLAFFGVADGINDDWAISPKRMIRSGEILAFVVKQLAQANEKERFNVLISTTGTNIEDFMPLSGANSLTAGPEWSLFSADLAQYVGKEVYIAIHCTSKTQMMLMVDDFYIGKPASELDAIASASKALRGFKVYLDNVEVATVDTTAYLFANIAAGEHTFGVKAIYQSGESEMRTLKLTVEDLKTISAKFVLNLSTNANEAANEAILTLTDTISKEVQTHTVAEGKVQINYLKKAVYRMQIVKDGFTEISETLNFSKDETLSRDLKEIIKAPVNAYVVVENKGKTADASFTWDNEVGFRDGFENYADFTQILSPWINLDFDAVKTFGLSTCTFPGAGGPLAAVVFNTATTTPPVSGDAQATPHSGNKHIIFVSTDITTPNDWLIAPKQEIRENWELRFFAKSYSNIYGLEKMNILISETNTDTASFVKVKSILAPIDWTEFKIDLSAYKGKNIHIAFNYVSGNTFYMLLDDVSIGSKEDAPNVSNTRVKNYKVFLNGELKATQKESEYVFTGLAQGTYVAGVQSEYASGLSTITTYNFEVKLIDNEDVDKLILSVYPNPVSGSEFNITSSQGIRHIRMISIDGKEVYSKYTADVYQMQIPIANFRAGMYILEMQIGKEMKQIKIVVR